MRKKLDTRFPAARIKKIMQADEDVGKIAMAVPVLVSKALELFLQDLCDRTYDITLQRGAKTVNSLHLKHCVQSYNVFDFLREVVSKVPDYGSSDAAADTSKRRKVAANELNGSDEESKRNNMQQEATPASSAGRRRGRGRGRGRGRASRAADRETPGHEIESSTLSQQSIRQISSPVRPMDDNSKPSETLTEDVKVVEGGSDSRNFDLNAGVDEGSNKMASTGTPVVASTSSTGPSDAKGEEYPGLSEADRMAIDPVHLAQLGLRLDEEDEDYDEEC